MKKKPKASVIRKATGPRRRVFPAHLSSTPDEWRTQKRQEWREVMAALDRYGFGSGYAPEQAAHWRLMKLATQIEEAVDAEGWVAW